VGITGLALVVEREGRSEVPERRERLGVCLDE
jgi:hypothetical protein